MNLMTAGITSRPFWGIVPVRPKNHLRRKTLKKISLSAKILTGFTADIILGFAARLIFGENTAAITAAIPATCKNLKSDS
ncbi:MAG: hypothetical protein OSJ58_15125 [Dysosmobacter sp.]|uniref:hypothetical protein n=1 Tax=uncultured Oscillibacter sp. TaxID=876091 RepID=UPI0026321069|nr:hypothetical protein [uncultured Oscillibacter sp.]MCX4373119.1 hypothetical protein [Dysosmobacter sp.]